MRILFTIAALCVVASLELNLQAQDRHGLRLGEFAPRTGVVITLGRMPTVIVGLPQFSVRRLRSPFAIQPLPSSFYWTAPIDTRPLYMPPPYVFVQDAPPSNSNQVNELSHQVQRLRKKIERLRDQKQLRDTRQAASEPPPSDEERTFPPTILIFRDGHQMEIQNYAIVGQTLSVFAEQSSTKISITDLDLETTQKVNNEHGVHFPLPR